MQTSADQMKDDMFDRAMEAVIASLPAAVLRVMETVPVVVEEEPDEHVRSELELKEGEELYGLYTGVMLTEKSVEDPFDWPEQIMLYRGALTRLAEELAHDEGRAVEAVLEEQVRITLLHEVGHHFGLDEDDLDEVGYA